MSSSHLPATQLPLRLNVPFFFLGTTLQLPTGIASELPGSWWLHLFGRCPWCSNSSHPNLNPRLFQHTFGPHPINLLQQAVKGNLSQLGRGIAWGVLLGCVVTFLDSRNPPTKTCHNHSPPHRKRNTNSESYIVLGGEENLMVRISFWEKLEAIQKKNDVADFSK